MRRALRLIAKVVYVNYMAQRYFLTGVRPGLHERKYL